MLAGYMTVTQAAEYLKRTVRTIRKQCKAGKFAGAEKAGNTWLIPELSVKRYSPGIIERTREEYSQSKH